MAIYIPKRRPPSSCDVCPCAHYSPFEDYLQCWLTADIISARPGQIVPKPETCPLIEIKEPHGDLVDIDKFKDDYHMGDDCTDCTNNVRSCEYDRVYSKMDFCSWLDDVDVVIRETNRK